MMQGVALILSVAAGALVGIWFQKGGVRNTRLLITFSGAYLLGVAVFHILPEVYHHSHASVGAFILIGFLLQLVLDWFSKGVEHGHGHAHLFEGKLPIGLLISLFLHAFLEALPLGFEVEHDHGHPLMWGIVIHKLPISLILYLMLRKMTRNNWIVALWLLAFALMAPLGSLLSANYPVLITYQNEVRALVFGIILHVSTTILFESDESHKFNRAKFLITVGAMLLAWLSVMH